MATAIILIVFPRAGKLILGAYIVSRNMSELLNCPCNIGEGRHFIMTSLFRRLCPPISHPILLFIFFILCFLHCLFSSLTLTHVFTHSLSVLYTFLHTYTFPNHFYLCSSPLSPFNGRPSLARGAHSGKQSLCIQPSIDLHYLFSA